MREASAIRFRVPIVLMALAVFCPMLAHAQEAGKIKASVPRQILLPEKLLAGAPATLAALDAAGRLAPGVSIELSTGQRITTDATGRALFMAPPDAGNLTARIAGQDITASTTVVPLDSPQAPVSSEGSETGARVLSYPRFIPIHDRFAIEGAGFRGQADANRVFLADQPCLVLAASPVSLLVLPGPHAPVGQMNLRLSVAGADSISRPVETVLLEVSGPAEAPNAGAQGTLTIRVHGTTQRLAIEVHNATPGIVELARGNLQRIVTSGGERNIAQTALRYLGPGDYTVTARVIPTASGLPDLEGTRQKLVSALALATGSWAERLDRLIRRIDRDPQDPAPIGAEIERLLGDRPSGQIAALLESAKQEFQKQD